EATRHKSVLQSALLAGPATPHDVLVALLVRPACAAFQLTPRADWVTTPEVRPSPPPCGWSIGFITTPRTDGRLPFQRMRPALPQLMFDCSALPTSPTVARQRASTLRISPEGIRNCAKRPYFGTSCTDEPADRAILAPPPGRISTACSTVPTGMLRRARLLPGLMSAPGPASTCAPCLRFCGARM